MRIETIGNATLYLGDCMESLRKMPDNSVDSIVTDPPYGLSFMGKKWDYDVPSVEIWAECLRVLKPGGHLLAFAGTRTQHRMAVRIEDAGFEIRDMIAWVYGSGFPKSMDVSKAIDKMDAADEQQQRRLAFTAWVRSQGVTSRQIDEATGTNMGGHYTTAASQPAIMTREHLEQCRHLFRKVPEWVEKEADIRSVESRNMAEREVVGQKTSGISNKSEADRHTIGASKSVVVDITAPATDAARQWQGWGTALKPALEPITVARKPLAGTVAANVLEWGTGAINVDGCRVPTEQDDDIHAKNPHTVNKGSNEICRAFSKDWSCPAYDPSAGRWPANLIHDGSEEVLAAFPEAKGQQGRSSDSQRTRANTYGELSDNSKEYTPRGDTGSAARFFYCAKASKRDRNASNASNIHPTVKPTDLMAYLCRLVTPPGGTVLDPFMGSGSTGKAAMREGFRFIGCELSPEYMTIARARIEEACKQPRLIMDEQPIQEQGAMFGGAA